MSAYVVSKETIDAVVALESTTLRGSKALTNPQIKQLGAHLWAVNAEAVAQRYGEDPEDLPDYVNRGLFHLRKIAAAKALQCLMYQCAEGDVPDGPTYKMLEELLLRTLKEIVRAIPEYEAASWNV